MGHPRTKSEYTIAEVLSVIGHEIQHAVDARHGFVFAAKANKFSPRQRWLLEQSSYLSQNSLRHEIRQSKQVIKEIIRSRFGDDVADEVDIDLPFWTPEQISQHLRDAMNAP